MSETRNKELLELLGAARSQLEYLHDLGFDEVGIPTAEDELPVCPVGVVDLAGQAACRRESLDDVRADLGDCQRCPLCKSRTHLVFGVGNP